MLHFCKNMLRGLDQRATARIGCYGKREAIIFLGHICFFAWWAQRKGRASLLVCMVLNLILASRTVDVLSFLV